VPEATGETAGGAGSGLGEANAADGSGGGTEEMRARGGGTEEARFGTGGGVEARTVCACALGGGTDPVTGVALAELIIDGAEFVV